MNDMSVVYDRCPHVVARKIGGDIIMVPIKHHVGDMTCLSTLNKVGAYIWEHLDGEQSVGEIVGELLEDFEVDRETATCEVTAFLDSAEQAGIVVKVSPDK